MYYRNIQKQSSFWNTYTTWTRACLVLHMCHIPLYYSYKQIKDNFFMYEVELD
jgi:hypothetical protein